jgi:hypothetical protein
MKANNPVNNSVAGKSEVVDNSGQTGAAPHKAKPAKAEDMPRKVTVRGAVNSNGRRAR